MKHVSYIWKAMLVICLFTANVNAQDCEKEFPEYGFKISLPCDIKTISKDSSELVMEASANGNNNTSIILRLYCIKIHEKLTQSEIEAQLKEYILTDKILITENNLKPVFTLFEKQVFNSNPNQCFNAYGYSQFNNNAKLKSQYTLFLDNSNYILLRASYHEKYVGSININYIKDTFKWLPLHITDPDLKLTYTVPRHITQVKKVKKDIEIYFTHKNFKSKLEIFKPISQSNVLDALQKDPNVKEFQKSVETYPDCQNTKFATGWNYQTSVGGNQFFVKLFFFNLKEQTLAARLWMEYNDYGIIATDMERDAFPILLSIK